MKKFTLSLLILYLIIPISVFAYSDYLIASGENIGIELKANNVIIVGSYDINNHNILKESGLSIGDKILKINEYEITSAASIDKILSDINQDKIEITYNRNNQEYKTNLILQKENNQYKTGLYVKDTIRGVATLTYIDTNSKMFGALGHGIVNWRSSDNIR